MTRYWIGTSGWHYDHWKGLFYPKDLPKKQWFAYYAERFETVELNNSFYRQPSQEAWRAWRDEAPDGFRFSVKANRYLTHIKRFNETGDSLKRFLDGARELQDSLGPVLYQAPPNFVRNETNFQRLDSFLAALPSSLRNVLEFRHQSWHAAEALDLLRRHNVALCVQDMQGLECPTVATASFAYVRLHGTGERAYEGNYDDDALEGWASKLRELAAAGLEEVWVYFNNDIGGHAVANARRLREILEVTPPDAER